MSSSSRRDEQTSSGRSEADRLRERVRRLEKQRRSLERERDEYRRALMARWKKESRLDDWSDFDPADYRFTLGDILAEFEKEEGACLPRPLSFASSTQARSRKSSKRSSARRKKRAN
jgi:hypothetical protein